VVAAISLLNLPELCSRWMPEIAPPSSIRSQKNWQRTKTCWLERNEGDSVLRMSDRYWTGLERVTRSSSLIYSLNDWTTSTRFVCLDSSSIMIISANDLQRDYSVIYSQLYLERHLLPPAHLNQPAAYTSEAQIAYSLYSAVKVMKPDQCFIQVAVVSQFVSLILCTLSP
jgi:hypothetical protein